MEENFKQEKTFYQDSTVTVTQARYIAGSKTYAMRNISSVSIFRIVESRFWPIIMGLIGLFVIVFSENEEKIIGIIILVLGILWYRSYKRYLLCKNQYKCWRSK